MPDSDSYTVKEIVDMTRKEQTAGFTKIESLLSTKADKADLEPIHQKLAEHDGHLRELQDAMLVEEKAATIRESRTAAWRWGIGTVAGVVAVIVGVILSHVH